MTEEQQTGSEPGLMNTETGVLYLNGQPIRFGDVVEFVYPYENEPDKPHRGVIVPIPQIKWDDEDGKPGRHSTLNQVADLTKV